MVSITTFIVCSLLMSLCMAAVHRALNWSLQAIHRERPVTEPARPELGLVDTIDRRALQLPFVGQERRKSETAEQAAPAALTGTTDALPGNVKPFKRRE